MGGGALWAVFATALGYLFGSTFDDSVWLPLALSLAIAAAISLLAELIRRRAEGGEGGGAPDDQPSAARHEGQPSPAASYSSPSATSIRSRRSTHRFQRAR